MADAENILEQLSTSKVPKTRSALIDHLPSEVVLCPYGSVQEKTCPYHWTTGEMPSKLDCYICRRPDKDIVISEGSQEVLEY